MVTFEIRYLDELITPEDVQEVIQRDLVSLSGEPKLKVTKIRNSKVLKLAIVEISAKGAKGAHEVLKTDRIKVGWVQGRIRRLAVVSCCYKCLGFGHFARMSGVLEKKKIYATNAERLDT